MCQKDTLTKLLAYATRRPTLEDDHDVAHKFPFGAYEILTSCQTVAEALIEGGKEPPAADVSFILIKFAGQRDFGGHNRAR